MLESQACNFIKNRLQQRCFPIKFAKYLRTPVLKNICQRLLLDLSKQMTPIYVTKQNIDIIAQKEDIIPKKLRV